MKKYLLALFVLSALLPINAMAAPTSTSPQTANYGDFYVGAGVGLVVPQGTSISLSSASGTVVSGTINYDDNAAILGMAGYHFNDYLAGEGELGYSSLDHTTLHPGALI